MTIIIVVSDRIVLGLFLTFSTCIDIVQRACPSQNTNFVIHYCTHYIHHILCYIDRTLHVCIKKRFFFSIRNDRVFEKRFMGLLLQYYVPTAAAQYVCDYVL